MLERTIFKGLSDRARSLWDNNNVGKELENLEKIFVKNGYTQETVRGYLFQQQPKIVENRK